MKTIRLSELLKLANEESWLVNYKFKTIDYHLISSPDEGTFIENKVIGVAFKTSTLYDISIRYHESYDYYDYDIETLDASNEGNHDYFEVLNTIVIDDEGYELDYEDLEGALPPQFSTVCYENFKQQTKEEPILIDCDSTSIENRITVLHDGKPNITFNGELIGNISSEPYNAQHPHYSGKFGFSCSLWLYKTINGHFVCEKLLSKDSGIRREVREAKVCMNINEVHDYFGEDWLALRLYDNTGI